MRITAWFIGLIVLLVLVFPEFGTATIGVATTWFIERLGAWVLWFSSALLILCLLLVAGPWGRIKLGR